LNSTGEILEQFRRGNEGDRDMRASLTKAASVSLAALALGLGTVAATTPASAAMWRGGGGFHGGWHGGGWRGGWAGGGWRGGWGWGGALAAGAIAGAALAAPYYYGGYYGSCVTYQPMYDAYGNYIGQQAVNMC
jgi:hypothetical protein